jgi:restriction endonuclease S subunit
MPRNKIVKFADKDIDVKEKKIGELEILVRELFPSTKGKLKNLDKALNDLEIDWDLLYKKLPVIFPDITEEDVKNAYMSELEKLLGAFVDVNFFALKQMIPKLMALAQTGSQRK